jgi:hypothetical protein
MSSYALRNDDGYESSPATQPRVDGQAALEVRASYHGVLIGARLLSDSPPKRRLIPVKGLDPESSYTIGASSAADAPAPVDVVGVADLPLVARWGAGFLVNVTPGMTGDVAVGGKVYRLADYLAGRGTNFTLPSDGRARIQCGEMSFQIAHTTQPAPLPRRWLAWRWNEQKFTLGSVLALGLFLLMLFAIPPEQVSVSHDFTGMTRVFVPFNVNGKEQDVPTFLTKPDRAPGQGEAGKALAGQSGKMGDRNSRKPTGRYAVKGNGQDMHLGQADAAARVREAGILGLIGKAASSRFASIFGRGSAVGDAQEDVMGQLLAANVDNGWGAGGFGISGTGNGGGGTGLATIGIGNYNTLGDGYGHDRAIGDLGHKREHKLGGVYFGQVTTRGALDKEIIRRVVRLHMNEVKYCYDQQLVTKPGLGGRISVQFIISGAGQVISSFVASTTMNNVNVESCVAGAIKRWEFPKPDKAGIAVVSYPFNFVAGSN